MNLSLKERSALDPLSDNLRSHPTVRSFPQPVVLDSELWSGRRPVIGVGRAL